MQVIMAIVQFIKKHKFFVMVLLIFIFSVVVNYMQTKDPSAKRLLDAELENSLGNQVEGTIKRLICETEEFQKKIDQINTELQSFIISNQKLSNKRIELLRYNQKIEFQLFIYDNQKLFFYDNQKLSFYWTRYIVHTIQAFCIQKWIEVIEKLVSDVHAIVHCIESHELCSKLGYNFEEYYANEIAVKVVYLIMKFKKENAELLDFLLLSELQAHNIINMVNKIYKNMEELNEEISKFKIYKKEELKRYHLKTVVQNQDRTIWSIIYRFWSWFSGLFWS